jgi:hypothetical protein
VICHMIMRTYFMSKELHLRNLYIMKKYRKVLRRMMMCTSCMSNYYLCVFLEIIDKKFRGKL